MLRSVVAGSSEKANAAKVVATTTTSHGFGASIQQVRYKRIVAYARFPVEQNFNSKPKYKTTYLKKAMDLFLGPKNFKGEYHFNKYYYSSTSHVPKYLRPIEDQGNSLIKDYLTVTGPAAKRKVNHMNMTNELQPFHDNDHIQTNFQISYKMKKEIVEDILKNNMSSQEAAVKYGLKIPRLEAILRLHAIEQNWKQKNLIKPEMEKMAHAIYKMLPIKTTSRDFKENLTEIPIPPETQRSRFLTIADSEPFGPIDASKIFGLEPAAKTLEKLSDLGEHSMDHGTTTTGSSSSKKTQFLAEKKKGERFFFKFTDVKITEQDVGYRYGTTNRDTKKDRKIGYDRSGKMIYLVQ